MKIILYTFFLLLMICCKDKNPEVKLVEEKIPSPEEVLRDYIKNPKADDRTCKEDIEKAEKDLEKYQKIYVFISCFGCKSKPYENEIKEYSVKEKVEIMYDPYSCVFTEGQTRGCYKATVDSRMEEIYGKDFRKNIEQAAEKLMIQKIKDQGKILSIYDLEENDKPHFIKEDNLIKDGYIPTIKTGFPLKEDRDHHLFMDISFIIEKNGRITNLKNENWVNEFKENEKYKNNLESIAKQEILTNYSNWKPGKYKNTIARVRNSFRVNFE
ncbi:hypothetical protein EG347_06830 [Chryseobacterium sp. G0186]|nr:hypothetical protein EG347_06830 [Chryseobacterium sp. G0186]